MMSARKNSGFRHQRAGRRVEGQHPVEPRHRERQPARESRVAVGTSVAARDHRALRQRLRHVSGAARGLHAALRHRRSAPAGQAGHAGLPASWNTKRRSSRYFVVYPTISPSTAPASRARSVPPDQPEGGLGHPEDRGRRNAHERIEEELTPLRADAPGRVMEDPALVEHVFHDEAHQRAGGKRGGEARAVDHVRTEQDQPLRGEIGHDGEDGEGRVPDDKRAAAHRNTASPVRTATTATVARLTGSRMAQISGSSSIFPRSATSTSRLIQKIRSAQTPQNIRCAPNRS